MVQHCSITSSSHCKRKYSNCLNLYSTCTNFSSSSTSEQHLSVLPTLCIKNPFGEFGIKNSLLPKIAKFGQKQPKLATLVKSSKHPLLREKRSFRFQLDAVITCLFIGTNVTIFVLHLGIWSCPFAIQNTFFAKIEPKCLTFFKHFYKNSLT